MLNKLINKLFGDVIAELETGLDKAAEDFNDTSVVDIVKFTLK